MTKRPVGASTVGLKSAVTEGRYSFHASPARRSAADWRATITWRSCRPEINCVVKSIADTDQAPQFTKVDQPVSRGTVAGLRVTTGTIPDYATEARGLLLEGVIGGGPAEQAGLTKGDIIVEIDDQTIANIYDYTYALELLRVNQPVKVVYLRGGERRDTSLTPVARR